MTYWLDYSAAKLSALTVENAGYPGVIRYIDSPDRLGNKHTNKAEYDDFIRNGVSVLLVFEVNTYDADGGWNQGVAYAQRARAGADYLGYKGPIFFCNDKTGVSNIAAWRAYLDGAASVLGIDRAGAYGFFNAMDTAIGHASYFWQAGRRSDVRSHVNIWQDNNVQVSVGGITCDRNLILKTIDTSPVVNINGKEDDMALIANSYDPTVDAAGNLYTRKFVFVVPTQSNLNTLFAKAWLSVKSGWGTIDSLHIQAIRSAVPQDQTYPVDQTWTNVKSDSERIVIEAPDGTDQFSVEIRSKVPFGITLEVKAR